MKPTIFALFLMWGLSLTAQAQSTSWSTATAGNWNTAGSWSPAIVPGVGTNATIAVAGTYIVTYDSPMSAASIASLTLGSSTVTLNLSAAGFNVAGTTTFVDSSTETVNINSGGVMTNSTLSMTSQNAVLVVNNGGVMTNGTTKVADNGNTDGSSQLKINSGAVANLGAVTVGRHTQSSTLGLNISSGTVIAKSIDIGSRNSYANMVVSGGNTTNAGSLRLGTGSPSSGREMRYRQTGGTVNCAGTVDMSVAAAATTWFSVVGTGATFSADGIRIFPNAVSSLVARFTNSGNIYLGASGFKTNNSGTYTVALEDLSVLGATADWAANVNMSTPSSGTITFKAADAAGLAHNITLTNPISGGANLAKSGGGALTLLGANSYTGNTTISAGTLVLGNSSALPKTILTLGGSGTAGTVDLAGLNPQISGLAVGSGATAASQLITNSSAANTSTLTFSNSAASSTFGGLIAGGSKPVALTVLGGNLTLSGQNNYAGNISISNGKLALNNAGSTFTGSSIVLSNSTANLDVSAMGGLTLAAGQSLSGYGVVTGSVTAANCQLIPGTNGGGGNLTFANNLTLNGNVTNQFDLLLDPSAAGDDQIIVGGTLNVSGVNVVNINPLAGSLLEGTYELFKCGSVGSGSTNNFQLISSPGPGLLAAISITSTGVDLVVTLAGSAERIWVGDGAANQWDFTTTNWLRAGVPDLFTNGNSATFDDSATNPIVSLAGALHPLSVTVNSTNDFTFTGAGKITGAISIEKTNSGALLLLTINDYNGVLTIDQGTIQVGNGVASGALGSGSLEDNGILRMQQPGSSTLSNVISGTGILVQAGTATLTLTASNTFTGGTLISSGTLQIGNGGTPSSGNVTNNAALVFNNSGNNSVNAIISGPGTVALLGAGTVTFAGVNTYTGATTISAGTLLVNGTNGTSAVTVNSGGKLGGKGKIGGTVTVNSGGIVSPGNLVGTLTIASNLMANAGTVLNFDLGTNSDKIIVGGNLNLAGTLNLTDAGGLGNGTYTLFTYGGSLVLNSVTFGTVPAGKLYELDTTTPGQVNLIVGVIATNVPAFPGALGFGSIVTGGRGKPVYHVTTLADSGAGSFRDAVSVSGRIIVFDVGGYISLNSAVSTKGNLTIAGQTAPGGGIGFKGGEISFAGQGNIICRYIRVRPGSDTSSSTDDALSLYTAHNVMLDHCSFEFAPWNNIDGVGDSTHVITNITFQSCIIADPTGQQFGAHTESVGGTWSWLYNLFVNSHNRNPLAKANTVFINNVEYNCSAGYTTHTSTPFKHDLVNNYFIWGPASGGNFPWYQIDNNQSMYFTGNLRDTSLDGVMNGSSSAPLPGYQGGGTILSAPWSTWVTNVPVYTPQSAFRLTTSRAGTFPRDELDTLIINQVKTLGNAPTGTGAGTAGPSGGLYTSQAQTGLGNNGYGTITGGAAPLDSDGDAMPDYWETAIGLNPNNANDATNLTLSGYSQLEVYLNWLGELHAVAQINTNLDLDLAQFASGFTNVSPVYSISNVVNGTASLLPDGHTVRYTAPANFVGRASFFFKVAGNDGTSMTNTVGLVITGVIPPQQITWHGDGIANTWNIATTTNWLNGNAPAVFHTGDSVTFDDTGSNSPAINLATTVTPGGITVASSNSYTFNGAGALAGVGTLTKSGSGTLTLGTTNSSFNGNIFVNGGTFALAAGSTLGSATLELSQGGILSLLSGSPSVFFGGSVSVSAGQSGTLSSGQLANGFSGLLTSDDNAGTLNLLGGFSFSGTSTTQFDGFTGTINIQSGSSLRFSANSSGNSYGSLNPNFIVNGTLQPRNAGNTVLLGQISGTGSLSGPQSNAGTGDTLYLIGGNNADANFSGSISSNTAVAGSIVSVTKTGTGTLTLAGISTFTGTTTVSNGTLIVNGTNSNSPAVVLSGTTLGGGGLIGGLIMINNGGNLVPGPASAGAGTLNLAGDLTLNTANLNFDLANVTTAGGGLNDLISMSGGTLTLSGTSVVRPSLLNGSLALGSYTLINGGAATTGSAANLAWGGVTGTRQTFTFDTSTPGSLLLNVSGSLPVSLVWLGTNGNNWDFTTTNWLKGTAADKFFNADSVLFSDISTNGTVTIASTMQPGLIVVSNAATAYSFSGSPLAGGSSLVKSGLGTLTLGGSNSFSGGTFINNGTLILANDIANSNALGTGTITFNGGTLTMFDNATTFNSATWNLSVPTNATGTFNTDSRCDLYGLLTGSGTLNLNIPYIRTSLYGDWSAFTGKINVTGGGEFRMLNFFGYPNAAISLSNNVAADFQGVVDPSGTTLAIGELSGVTSAKLLGGVATNGEVLTWNIGGRNTDATFAGQLGEQTASTITAINKIGTGRWTLTGSNTYNGGTFISGGSLLVNSTTGSATGSGDVEALSGATLTGTGTISGSVVIDAGATLTPGNPTGALNIGGDLNLDATSVLRFALGTSSSLVNVTGNLALAGTFNITNALGFGAGTYTLLNYSGALNFGAVIIASAPAGYIYALNTNTAGAVKLVVQYAAPATPPVFGGINLSGNNFIFTGTGGVANATFYLLGTTNVATPRTNWARLLTNQFDSGGNFNFTNATGTNSQNFYLLQLQ